MIGQRVLVVALALLVGLATPAAAVVDTRRVDRLVERTFEVWGEPGLALAVVDLDGQSYVKGYGVRDLRTRAPVTADTLFALGSCSKAMGAAAVARLVDEGRLAWDTPVRERLPWFKASDPWVTGELRVRDLLTHNAGLRAGMPRAAAESRRAYLETIADTPPMHRFRAQFAYANDMFTLSGELVEAAAGEPWETFVGRRFWTPLGMTRTGADYLAARADPNSASPHLTINGALRPVPWVYEDRTALPSGGVNSTAADMARWVRFQLEAGRGDRPLLSRAAFEEMHAPQTPLRGAFVETYAPFSDVAGEGPMGVRYAAYGMGWFVHDYRGHKVLFHPGSIDGFRCMVGLLPEDGFGFAILVNNDQLALPQALTQSLIDLKLGLPERDWMEPFHQRQLRLAAQREAEAQAQAVQRTDQPPGHPLAAYTGRYVGPPSVPALDVRLEGQRLVATLGRVDLELTPWGGESFRLTPRRLRREKETLAWPYPGETWGLVRFQMGSDSLVAGLTGALGSLRRVPSASR
jgi:CubicO group peptidase (beta-lactamase class C family)